MSISNKVRRILCPLRFSYTFAIFVLLATLPLHADDWPEWRGAGRLGVWNETDLLETFPEDGLVIDWRAPIGSGYGGPAVADGRVFVTEFERTQGSDGIERLVVLDEDTGERLWAHSWEISTAGLQPTYANGPRATPTVDGDRVYILGSSGRLLCLLVADGTLVWQRDYVTDFAAEVPAWGMTGAPLVDGDRLLLLVGGEPDALAVGLDKMTGKEIWRSLATDSEPGYAPPIIVEAGGTRQLIIWHPTGIASLDPATGEPFWQEPYEVAMGQTISQPVIADRRLVVSFCAGWWLRWTDRSCRRRAAQRNRRCPNASSASRSPA